MRRSVLIAALLAGVALPSGAVRAEGVIGTANVAPIEPDTVPVPDSTPCDVTLFDNTTFGGDAVAFPYGPPAACPGPWAKVVLRTDISVTAGRQFDRTATIFVGGVPLLFGTTAEPRATLAPFWHVERDVTIDTALLADAQQGRAQIANYQTDIYTSAITASAHLLFYPATRRFPAPRTPDLVLPLAADAAAGPTMLNSGTDTLARTATLPGTIERAELQLYTQSQAGDEFWYTCVPDAVSTALETCGGGAFREGMVTVDGIPAGIAPVFPWIYTGGIDPYLWQPTPGVQTLAFEPARVELTPFAGLLDNGKPHQIAVAVRGANSGFSTAGTLYLTLDRQAHAPLRGALLSDTLAETVPSVDNSVSASGSGQSGDIDTTARNDYRISGILQTSHGPVTTEVSQRGSFSNRQHFEVNGALDDQAVEQQTDTATIVTTTDSTGVRVAATALTDPLSVRYRYAQANDGSGTQATAVSQTLRSGTLSLRNGVPVSAGILAETVAPNDTLVLSASGSLTSHTGSGSASYLAGTLGEGCAERQETSQNSVLSTQTSRTDCDVLQQVGTFDALRALSALVR